MVTTITWWKKSKLWNIVTMIDVEVDLSETVSWIIWNKECKCMPWANLGNDRYSPEHQLHYSNSTIIMIIDHKIDRLLQYQLIATHQLFHHNDVSETWKTRSRASTLFLWTIVIKFILHISHNIQIIINYKWLELPTQRSLSKR